MSVYWDSRLNHYAVSYSVKIGDKFITRIISRKSALMEACGCDFTALPKREQKLLLKSVEYKLISTWSGQTIAKYANGQCTFGQECDDFIKWEYSALKKGTAYNKSLIIGKYIKPFFKQKYPLDKAVTMKTMSDFRNMVVSLDYEPKWKNKILCCMNEIIVYSADHDHLNYDYAKRLQRMLAKVCTTGTLSSERPFWLPDQMDKFLDTFKEDDDFGWKVLFETSYFGALRIGEVLGLKWKDLGSDSNKLSIVRTLDTSGHEATTKNQSSNDTITIPSRITADLLKLKEIEGASDEDYMFFVMHTSRTSIRRVMDKHTEEAGLPHMNFHGLRHSMASRMINAGFNVLQVSKHMRHANTQQTLNTYSHLWPANDEDLMDKI